MVLTAARRKELATKLNDMVDIPFVGEAQEQMIAEKLIDCCMGPLESVMPSDDAMRSLARSTGDETTMQQQIKEDIVTKLNKKIDIPFATESHEALVIGLAVDYLMKEKFEEIHESLVQESAAGEEAEAAAPAEEASGEIEC